MSEFKLNVKEIINYGGYKQNGLKAAELFVAVFNLPQFKDAVTNFMWNGNKAFANNAGLSNEQVFEKLFAGSEISNVGENETADITLRAYSKWWPLGPAIGFTDVENGIIYTKWQFISRHDVNSLAGHYAHEYCHCLGFEHDYDVTIQRPFSVPYAIGDIVEKISRLI